MVGKASLAVSDGLSRNFVFSDWSTPTGLGLVCSVYYQTLESFSAMASLFKHFNTPA